MAATVDRGKKSHSQKVESYLLFGDFPEYFPETASQIALRNFSKQVREEPGYLQVLAGKKETQLVDHQTSQWLMLGNIRCLLG